MSLKSIFQIFILLVIILIIGSVYIKYFDTKENVVNELRLINENNEEILEELEKKIFNLEKENKELSQKIIEDEVELTKNLISEDKKNLDVIKDNTISKENNANEQKPKTKIPEESKSIKKEVKNLVKDVEYTSIDQKGNKFYLLATSGKSNVDNSDILDLENVRGTITSDFRDTIYIVSDFAEYNSINLHSKFYSNVVINYQDKQINCINFDINMETNKAIAYNDVIITDPKSVMKAGIVEFDLKTKNIDIKPESSLQNIKVVTN